MRKRLIHTIIVTMVLLTASAGFVYAQYDINDLASDMESVTEGLAEFFGDNLGAMSYLGDPVGYAFIKNFTLGIGGGAALVPVENLSFAEGTGLNIDWGDMKNIPVPVIGAYTRFSLKKLEFGFKLAGFPKLATDDLEVKNLILGGKVRYKLVSFNRFLIKGGVSAGGLFEYVNGSVLISQGEGFPIYDPSGTVQIGTMETTSTLDTSWSGVTLGGEAQANLQIAILNIYTGTRMSKTFGKATSEFKGDVTLSGSGVVPASEPIGPISNEGKAGGIDIYGFGGLEVKVLILTVGGRITYNFTNDNLTIDGGVRFQF